MAGGARPRLSVKFKSVDGGKPISLAAWWDRDGKLSGGWDREVRQVDVTMMDGSIHRIVGRQEGGKMRYNHYLNAYLNEPEEARREVAPPVDDDDVPF